MDGAGQLGDLAVVALVVPRAQSHHGLCQEGHASDFGDSGRLSVGGVHCTHRRAPCAHYQGWRLSSPSHQEGASWSVVRVRQ